jgi:hypothetical protein
LNVRKIVEDLGHLILYNVIRTKPVNLIGLWELKVLLPETRELLDLMGEIGENR